MRFIFRQTGYDLIVRCRGKPGKQTGILPGLSAVYRVLLSGNRGHFDGAVGHFQVRRRGRFRLILLPDGFDRRAGIRHAFWNRRIPSYKGISVAYGRLRIFDLHSIESFDGRHFASAVCIKCDPVDDRLPHRL